MSPDMFYINPDQRDSVFKVSSNSYENSLYMNGDNGYLGLNTIPNTSWGAVNSLLEFDGSFHTNPTLFVNSATLYTVNNTYAINTGATGFKRIIADNATQIKQTASDFDFASCGSDAIDSTITWLSRVNIGLTETIINGANEDYDFKVSTDNYPSSLFVCGSNDSVGIHTTTPLDNVCTANGDFAQYGWGLHIKAPDSESIGFLIIEGGQVPDGASPVSAALILCDNDADADEKMMLFTCANNKAKFASLDDDVSSSIAVNVDNILTMQLSTGEIGMGKVPVTGARLALSFSTDDISFKDADDSATAVGALTAVLVVDIGSDTNVHIPAYVPAA